MPASTNSLVAKLSIYGKRLAVPAAFAGAVFLGATLVVNHGNVHAASFSATPLDDNSVSSLVALDNAVESVAARVTPAVVNIAVTSKTNGDVQTDSDSDSDDDAPQQNPHQRRNQGQGPADSWPSSGYVAVLQLRRSATARSAG